MLPITEVRIDDGAARGPYMKFVRGWKQKPPYNLLLTYNGTVGYFDLQSSEGDAWGPYDNAGYCSWVGEQCSSGIAVVDNATYSGFIGKMKAENSSLGVTLGEHSAARKMIGARTHQLLGLTEALIKRDFRRAYRVVRRDFNSKGSSFTKNFANLYLEWSWGWRPMVEDIGKSLDVLTSPLTPLYVRAARTKEYDLRVFDNHVDTTYGPNRIIANEVEDWHVKYTSSTGGRVAIDNPNVALRNRLGLLNLPQILWATYPLSFIVDKYVNIGQMIGSLTDTYGFTFSDTWTSRKTRIDVKRKYEEFVTPHPPGNPQGETSSDVRSVIGFAKGKTRQNGLLGPQFALRTPTISGLGEAVSYMALLIQLMKK